VRCGAVRCDNTVWGSANGVAANGSLPLLLNCGGLKSWNRRECLGKVNIAGTTRVQKDLIALYMYQKQVC
jgi:hypothetical protein